MTTRTTCFGFLAALLFSSIAASAAGWHASAAYDDSAQEKASPGVVLYCEPNSAGCDPIDVTACAVISVGFDADRLSAVAGSATVMPQRCEAPLANAGDANCLDLLESSLGDAGYHSFDAPSPGVVRLDRTAAHSGDELPRASLNCTR